MALVAPPAHSGDTDDDDDDDRANAVYVRLEMRNAIRAKYSWDEAVSFELVSRVHI